MDLESGAGGVTPAMARTFPVKSRNSNLVGPDMHAQGMPPCHTSTCHKVEESDMVQHGLLGSRQKQIVWA